MSDERLIVIGASMGGVEALSRLVADLPADLPAAVCIVQHVSPLGESFLPQILARGTKLDVHHAIDGEVIRPGRIYVAPPDHHLLVRNGYLQISRGPRHNRHRPAIDATFRSAASSYGKALIGVVLTGSLDDGTAGLAAIKANGGLAVVQDPLDAACAQMPLNALREVDVDHTVPLAQMGALLDRLVREPRVDSPDKERATDAEFEPFIRRQEWLTCPECGGRLEERDQQSVLRFECRVGHTLSTASLEIGQQERVEQALWAALNALEERATLARRMAEWTRTRGMDQANQRHMQTEVEANVQADMLRGLLLGSKR